MSKIRTGIKMRVTPEQSRKVQEICFENDVSWGSGKILKYLDEPFIYLNTYDLLGYGSICQEGFFIKDENKEVSAELFIRTNGTCVKSSTPTENNNKGEQMEELKLECLVEGYEGTYFEVGQVWETRDGNRFKVKGFDFKKYAYKLTMTEVEYLDEEYYYPSNGEFIQGRESDLDLVKLISTETSTESTLSEEPQPKTLSEYLKENNAYESFVENSVARALENPKNFLNKKEEYRSKNYQGSIGDFFIWSKTLQGEKFWIDLVENKPNNLVYDLNEIIFTEVDKRIAEQKAQTETLQPEFISTEEFNQMLQQKPTTKYMVFVEGRSNPKKIHDSYDSAEKEAKRLSAKEIGCNVFVVEIIKAFKSRVIVEEIK